MTTDEQLIERFEMEVERTIGLIEKLRNLAMPTIEKIRLLENNNDALYTRIREKLEEI